MGGGGGGGAAPKTPPFEPGKAEFPTGIAMDRLMLGKSAADADQNYYATSDADFKRRHRGLFQAEKLFETSVLKDQQGESALTPALQAEFTRAGLTGAGNALSGAESVATPGSAGEASLATHLGQSIM